MLKGSLADQAYRRNWKAGLASCRMSTAGFFASTKNFLVPPIRKQ